MTMAIFITANGAPQKKQPPKLLRMEVNQHSLPKKNNSSSEIVKAEPSLCNITLRIPSLAVVSSCETPRRPY